jgi:hypothetical protein
MPQATSTVRDSCGALGDEVGVAGKEDELDDLEIGIRSEDVRTCD